MDTVGLRVKLCLPWLRQVVLSTVFGTHRLFFKTAQVGVLGQNRVREVLLDCVSTPLARELLVE